MLQQMWTGSECIPRKGAAYVRYERCEEAHSKELGQIGRSESEGSGQRVDGL